MTFLSISGRSSRQVVCTTCVGGSGGASGSKFTCCPTEPRKKPPATAVIRPLVVSDAILKGKLFVPPPWPSSSSMSSPGVVLPLANWSSSSYALSVMLIEYCHHYDIKLQCMSVINIISISKLWVFYKMLLYTERTVLLKCLNI